MWQNTEFRNKTIKAQKEAQNRQETKRKNSEQSKDRAWLSKQGERSVFVKKDKFNYYLNLGYHFGRN